MGTIVIKDHIDENKEKEVQATEKKRLFNAYKHCGIIKWKIEPVKYQRELRNEWNHPNRY